MKQTALNSLSVVAFFLLFSGSLPAQSPPSLTVTTGCTFGDFSLPNAFTPNGDGFNDAFCLQGWDNCINKFSVSVFNRWGEKVFESFSSSFCWDGSYKGQVMETDVYVYMIEASFTNEKTITRQGNITLMR